MFWQRQCLNIFIKKGGRLVKGSRRVCGLPLICFDIPCSLIMCSVRAHRNPHEMQSRIKQAPLLHAHSFTSPPVSTRQGPPSPGATPALREHLCGTGYPGCCGYLAVTWDGWGDTSRLSSLAPGQPKHLSPHLCKPSADFYVRFPSIHIFCVSRSPLRVPEHPGCHLTSGFTSDALVDENRLTRTDLADCWFSPALLLVCSFRGQAASFTKSLGLFTYGNQHEFTQTGI